MTAISALADVDVCNMSLSHLGQSQGIQSLNPPDPSPQAKACAFWYPKMRDWLLKSAPWDFAYVNQALANDATTFPGWKYGYQYPNDCLQAVAVTTKYGLRFGAYFWSTYWGLQSQMFGGIPKIPYKVVQSTVAGKAIMCDLAPTDPVYLFYIQGVTDTSLFDSMFTDCLSFYVAARIGGTLRSDAQKVQAAAQSAQMLRLEAMAQMMNQSQQDPERVSPSISVRW
jgi:hypothetical protein